MALHHNPTGNFLDLLITTTVSVKVVSCNKKKYSAFGYGCEIGDTLEVAFEHAPAGTQIKYLCSRCKTECSTKKHVYEKSKHKACKSCAQHLGTEHTQQDLTGQKFNRLTVIGLNTRVLGHESYWNTLCDCGNEHVVTARNLKSGNVSSCGCYSTEVHRDRMLSNNNPTKGKKGDLHHNWNPDVSEKIRNRRRKNLYEVKKLRQEIFQRDDYTCKICKKRGISLHAHHIYSWKHYPELRYDQDNLTTMCTNCHHKYHSQTKIKEVNQETFNTFKNACTQS